MYRRRQKQQEKKEEKKVEEVKPIESEPVIKKVIVVPKGAVNDYGKVPMVNILRNISYFKDNGSEETPIHAVPFEKMIDIVFSQGYLNVEKSLWYKNSDESEWGTVKTEQAETGTFTDTTAYKRNTFMCGDVIFTRDEHKSFAFLITRVYGNYYGEDNNQNDIISQLQYLPPIGGDQDADDIDDQILSTFVTCNGNVYAFTKNAKFGDIKGYVSKSGDDYVYLEPSNKSKFDGVIPDTNRTGVKTAVPSTTKPEYYPLAEQVPEAPEESGKTKFNLTNGVVVEGWFIYMKSTAEVGEQTPANIIGDIVRSGPIVIAKVGSSLSIGSSLRIPFVVEGDVEGKDFYYDGNDTKFASEPLNSEQYQVNYGDITGSRSYKIKESKIYSLTYVMEYAKEDQEEPEQP